MYPATDEPIYRTYWDAIFLYGVVPMYGEAGFYTNQVWSPWGWRYLGQWWYIPQWTTGGSLSWHTDVWPVGF